MFQGLRVKRCFTLRFLSTTERLGGSLLRGRGGSRISRKELAREELARKELW